nr:hypothetical protein [uncultured bacterium]
MFICLLASKLPSIDRTRCPNWFITSTLSITPFPLIFKISLTGLGNAENRF